MPKTLIIIIINISIYNTYIVMIEGKFEKFADFT